MGRWAEEREGKGKLQRRWDQQQQQEQERNGKLYGNCSGWVRRWRWGRLYSACGHQQQQQHHHHHHHHHLRPPSRRLPVELLRPSSTNQATLRRFFRPFHLPPFLPPPQLSSPLPSPLPSLPPRPFLHPLCSSPRPICPSCSAARPRLRPRTHAGATNSSQQEPLRPLSIFSLFANSPTSPPPPPLHHSPSVHRPRRLSTRPSAPRRPQSLRPRCPQRRVPR